MYKKLFLLITLAFMIVPFLMGIETDTTNVNHPNEQPVLIPLNLPTQYNASYALGIYEGAHKSTSNAYLGGFFIGLAFNYIGVAITPFIIGKSDPDVFPENVNKIDFTKGYYETSAVSNRSSAVKGASTAAIIETVLLMGAVIFAAGD